MKELRKRAQKAVCNFPHDAIQLEYDPAVHSKITLLADTASRQNRNYTVFTILAMLSIQLNVEIWHVFPVRGHSYCQRDRNFGTYASKKKKMERIETAEKYFDFITNARDPPFDLVKSTEDVIQNFDTLLNGMKKKPEGDENQ